MTSGPEMQRGGRGAGVNTAINRIANMMFESLAIEVVKGWAYVSFHSWNQDKTIRRRWDAREGSHFPTWRDHPWGGTRSCCIDALCRKALGKPVFPLGTWHYLIDGPAKLCQPHGDMLKNLLIEAAWPVNVPCVLCGKSLASCGDWWTISKGRRRISGPSCSMRDCREPVPKEN